MAVTRTIGRPTSTKPLRDHGVTTMLTAEEHEALRYAADNSGNTQSDVLRLLVLRYLFDDEEDEE